MSAVSTPGTPRTIVEPGTGTGTLSVQLPPGVTLDLESVLANIDASGAGGPVTATLAVSEQSGVVIATKRQGETVDAGILGTATWALRLDDESAAAGPTVGPLEYIGDGTTNVVAPGAPTNLTWTHQGGANLLAALPAVTPTLVAAGVYAFYLEAVRLSGAAGAFKIVTNFAAGIGGTVTGVPASTEWTAASPLLFGPSFWLTRAFNAGDGFTATVWHNAAGNINVGLFGTIQQLA